MAKTNRRQVDPVERRQRLERINALNNNLRSYQRRTIDYMAGDSDDDFEDDFEIADEISSRRTNAAY